jgi:ubiquinone/menaquinone biosynthesis C-methylase UbiE
VTRYNQGPNADGGSADLWDRTAQKRISEPLQGWLDSPIVLEAYVQPRFTGNAKTNWLAGMVERLEVPKSGRWLSLGCGAAGQEIAASKWGLFAKMLALDNSPRSLELARQAALEQRVKNIDFEKADLDHISLPVSRFDVVLMNMSLHHVRGLRPLLQQVRRSLKPGGLLLANEFIGPRQFQFSDRQLRIVADLLSPLPVEWRRDSATGTLKTQYVRMPVEHWNAADPSEAIRSDRIVAEVTGQFRIIDRLDYGGTILNLLLEHIVHNFDAKDNKDVGVIRLLAKFEEILIREDVLTSDFSVIAARTRSPTGAALTD